MKLITDHLGQIIAVIAAISLLITSIVFFKGPVSLFFENIIEKETSIGDKVFANLDNVGMFDGEGGSDGGSGSGGAGGGSGETGDGETEQPEQYVAGLYETGAIEFYNTYGTGNPAPELNEHGFYFGEKYYTDDGNGYFVFYEDGSAKGLVPGNDSVVVVPAGMFTYTSDGIYEVGEKFADSFSPDGKQMNSAFGNLTVELSTELSDMLIATWDELVDYGYMTVTDGALYHTSTANARSTYAAMPTCELAGDLFLPQDGNITSIATEAFDHECKQLTGILIPNGVTAIGDAAFNACESLKSITIPEKVTSIGEGAFADCTNLTNITFEGTVAQWEDITLGDYFACRVGATEIVCSDGTISLK